MRWPRECLEEAELLELALLEDLLLALLLLLLLPLPLPLLELELLEDLERLLPELERLEERRERAWRRESRDGASLPALLAVGRPDERESNRAKHLNIRYFSGDFI